jgi:hypothetical protein
MWAVPRPYRRGTAHPQGMLSVRTHCPATATELARVSSAIAAVAKVNVLGGKRRQKLHPICRMGGCRRGPRGSLPDACANGPVVSVIISA